MKPLQPYMDTIVWAGQNFSYNLDFIPDDKLNWKPAPDAKSALEIAAEVAGVVKSFGKLLQTGEMKQEFPTFESRQAAKDAVEAVTKEYAEYMGTLGLDDIGGEIDMGFAVMPKLQVISIPMVETVHHHGQIAYIQTLLGDTESHFFGIGS